MKKLSKYLHFETAWKTLFREVFWLFGEYLKILASHWEILVTFFCTCIRSIGNSNRFFVQFFSFLSNYLIKQILLIILMRGANHVVSRCSMFYSSFFHWFSLNIKETQWNRRSLNVPEWNLMPNVYTKDPSHRMFITLKVNFCIMQKTEFRISFSSFRIY